MVVGKNIKNVADEGVFMSNFGYFFCITVRNDACFLECADSLRSPLLTLDHGMKRIAKEMGITILE